MSEQPLVVEIVGGKLHGRADAWRIVGRNFLAHRIQRGGGFVAAFWDPEDGQTGGEAGHAERLDGFFDRSFPGQD